MFDDLVPGQQTFDLSQLTIMQPEMALPPEASRKTRSAFGALLSGTPTPTEKYQALLTEYELGSESSLKGIFDSEAAKQGKLDMQSVMTVLADPMLSIDHKRKVLSSINSDKSRFNPSSMLMTNALSAPSGTETPGQERARMSVADILGDLYKSIDEVQGIVNAHGASLTFGLGKTSAEMVEHWVMPFGNNIATGNLSRARAPVDATWWDRMKGYVWAGDATEKDVATFANMPPAQRAAWLRSYLADVQKNSGIVFSNENQFLQFQQLQNVVNGDYGNFEKFLDNYSPILDILGIGQMLRAGKKLKAAKSLDKVPPMPTLAPKPDEFANKRKAAQDYARAEVDAPPSAPPPSPAPFDDVPTPTVAPRPADAPPAPPAAPTSAQSTLLGGTGKKVEEEVPKKKLAALFTNIEINGVVRTDNPAAPAKVVQQVNPDQGRALHEAAVTGTDEVAGALYGTNRTDAVASDIIPQATTNKSVLSRIPEIYRNLRAMIGVPDELLHILHARGHIEILPEEKAAVHANVVRDFRNVDKLTPNDAMSSFSIDGGQIKIGAVYGTTEGGFATVTEALDHAKFALRKYGIVDSDIEILRKDGINHVPVNPKDYENLDGNYLIRINTSHDIDPTDIPKMLDIKVGKLNVFDSFSQLVSNTKGSLTRWLFDPASLLDKSLVGGASTVSDVTARMDKFLFGVANEFAKVEKKLSSKERDQLWEYLKEANFEGKELSTQELIARGFNDKQLEAVSKWRRFWDNHFYLENYDLIKTLIADGFQMFRTETDEFFVKPVMRNVVGAGVLKENSVVGGTRLYNPAGGGSTTVLTAQELDDLYKSGGTIARFRRPIEIDGEALEYIIVRNTPREYVRKFRDTDIVLNYRPGYFQLQYTAPKFIERIYRKADGSVSYTKAVGVAGDSKEAEFYRTKLAQDGNEYSVRGDDRALQKDLDAWWDVNSANGRIAQRHRGKLLEDATGLNHFGDQSYILNPVESAVRAARSIAGRSISRPMLETAKARFVSQYGKFLTGNKFGELRFPNKLEEIGAKGQFTTSELADARTTWEYINYLENGYINSADALYKTMLNFIADRAGKVGLSTVERTANKMGEGSHGPISLTKNLVFMAYIGTNVLRQWVVQPHQVLRTVAYNPKGWATGAIQKYSTAYIGDLIGIKQTGDMAEFATFVKESGFLDNVDKQNLVRGVLKDAADRSNVLQRWAVKPFNVSRQVGFDMGERANMLGHLAAVFDKYKREGKVLSTKVGRDEAYSEARAISYDMNFAGDMPYNQTTPALFLQFMQVPHKALLQLTNKRIPWDARMRMIIGDMVFWGTPAYMVSDLFGEDVLPDNPVHRDLLVWGAESWAMNWLFSKIAGEEVKIDFSSLGPYGLEGWGKAYVAIREGGMKELIAMSPSYNLLFKDGSRFENVMMKLGRFMNIIEDDEQTPETAWSVIEEALRMSSGYSNAYKAKMLMETRKVLDQYGNTMADKAGKWEAAFQLLGFGTEDTRDWYKASSELYKDKKKMYEELDKSYQDMMRMYADKLKVDNTDPKFMTSVSSFMLKTWGDNPEALEYINKKWISDVTGKDNQLLLRMLRASGVLSPDDIRNAPITEEQKKIFFDVKEKLEKAEVE